MVVIYIFSLANYLSDINRQAMQGIAESRSKLAQSHYSKM